MMVRTKMMVDERWRGYGKRGTRYKIVFEVDGKDKYCCARELKYADAKAFLEHARAAFHKGVMAWRDEVQDRLWNGRPLTFEQNSELPK